MTPTDHALGALYGLALGDALGMPTQAFSRGQIQARFGHITTLENAAADQPIAPNMPLVPCHPRDLLNMACDRQRYLEGSGWRVLSLRQSPSGFLRRVCWTCSTLLRGQAIWLEGR